MAAKIWLGSSLGLFQNCFDQERHDLRLLLALWLVLSNAGEGATFEGVLVKHAQLSPCGFSQNPSDTPTLLLLFHLNILLVFGRLESPIKMLQERCHLVQLLQAVCSRFVLPYLIRPWAVYQLILVDLVFCENLHQNRSRIAIDVPFLELFPFQFFSHVVSARSPACVRLHRMFRPCDPPWYLFSSQRLRKKKTASPPSRLSTTLALDARILSATLPTVSFCLLFQNSSSLLLKSLFYLDGNVPGTLHEKREARRALTSIARACHNSGEHGSQKDGRSKVQR